VEGLFFRFANDFVMIGIYLVLALSLNLINGYAGLFSLGHAGFWAVGAYTGSACIVYMHALHPGVPGAALFCLGMCAAVVFSALAGLLLGLPCLRLRGDYLAIATLGFSLIVVNVLDNLNVVGGARGFPFGRLEWPDSAVYQLSARLHHNVIHMILAVAAVVVCTLVIRNIVRSSHGRAIISIREDELAGQMCGINIVKYKLFVFVLGAAFAGAAGVLYSTFNYRIEPRAFDFMAGVRILLMVVLGGMGSLTGTFIAVVILYEAPELLRLSNLELLGQPVADWWAIIYALLLVGLMLLRPQGLLGKREITDIVALPRTRRAAARLAGGADED